MKLKTEHLKDYLRGMKRVNNQRSLAQLMAIADWSAAAQRELERRAAMILNMLPDEIIIGLASGAIDMHKAIADVLAE